MTLIIAFNYGGRDEIVRATRKIVADVSEGRLDAGRCRTCSLVRHGWIRQAFPIPIW